MFATIDPNFDGGTETNSSSGSTTTTTDSTDTTSDDSSFDLDEVASGTDGGYATTDPYVGTIDTTDSTDTSSDDGETGIDDFRQAESTTLASGGGSTGINTEGTNEYETDPRLYSDTTGMAGGEVENTVPISTGWGGGIAFGLDPYGQDIDGDGLTDAQEQQVDAIDDTADDQYTGGPIVEGDDADLDPIPEDSEPDFDGDGEPGGNLTDNPAFPDAPNVPAMPDVGGFIDDLENSLVLLVALAVLAYFAVQEAGGSSA